jgi:HD-GYP domain-containing protein (c-di-GMP phosphodiesterase class II)
MQRMVVNTTEKSSYIPVRLETLRGDTRGNFDVYIQPHKGKMVLYHKGGDFFPKDIKEGLAENDIRSLYIHRGDKDNYLKYVENNIASILRDPDISPEAKSKMAYKSISNIAYSLIKTPQWDTMNRYRAVISGTVSLINREKGVLDKFMKLAPQDFATYTHSINVGFYALALAKKLFENDKRHNILNLAHAFFLHDVGKSGIPLSILHKRGKLNHEEWRIIKSHPARGFKLLNDLDVMTDEMRIIVLQHHERHNGSGYPKGLRDNEIHLYAKICMIADAFDALTSTRPYKRKHSTFDALKIMKMEMSKEFDPRLFIEFVKLFSADIKRERQDT